MACISEAPPRIFDQPRLVQLGCCASFVVRIEPVVFTGDPLPLHHPAPQDIRRRLRFRGQLPSQRQVFGG